MADKGGGNLGTRSAEEDTGSEKGPLEGGRVQQVAQGSLTQETRELHSRLRLSADVKIAIDADRNAEGVVQSAGVGNERALEVGSLSYADIGRSSTVQQSEDEEMAESDVKAVQGSRAYNPNCYPNLGQGLLQHPIYFRDHLGKG